MGEESFWLDAPAVLADNYLQLVPSTQMTLVQKLNSIMRLGILAAVVLTVVTGDKSYLLIAPAVAIVTILLNKQQQPVESFFSGYQNRTYLLPTVDNPFGNFDKIADPKDRPPMIPSHNNAIIKEVIDTNFNERLYRGAGDLFHKENEQRIWYTMPSTTAAPDTTGLAKWLYSTGSTCKEDGTQCAPYWDPLK